MHLYNSQHVITKYGSTNDILIEFCRVRYEYYDIRRKYYLKMLQLKMDILKFQAMFIGHVLDRTIIIERKKRSDVIERLTELNYPKLVDDVDAKETDKSYKYLTDLPLFCLTQDKIDELEEKIRMKQKEYDVYYNTTLADLWKNEIKEFLEILEIFLNRNDNTDESLKQQNRKRKTKM
jgi:DNA topoisomerase-2